MNNQKTTIVLISCSKTKDEGVHRAEDLYKGAAFKKELEYAKTLTSPDNIYILSAKYGLVELSERLENYDKTLLKCPQAERRQWAAKVMDQLKAKLREKGLKEEDVHFVVLAGKKYREFLELDDCEVPFEGLRQGELLQKLNTLNLC